MALTAEFCTRSRRWVGSTARFCRMMHPPSTTLRQRLYRTMAATRLWMPDASTKSVRAEDERVAWTRRERMATVNSSSDSDRARTSRTRRRRESDMVDDDLDCLLDDLSLAGELDLSLLLDLLVFFLSGEGETGSVLAGLMRPDFFLLLLLEVEEEVGLTTSSPACSASPPPLDALLFFRAPNTIVDLQIYLYVQYICSFV